MLDYGTADERAFLCGASSKDAGARITSIVEDYGVSKYAPVIATLLKNPTLILPQQRGVNVLKKKTKCYIYTRVSTAIQIDDMLAKLITAMTKEGKLKNAIQDKIGATVDTTDLEKQLSVLNASLHQAETIKTRLEQQMDNLDVTDTHYDKKISDLQRRLDAQYDRIDEVEEIMTELKSQIYELKKNQIDADSIYGFLGSFNKVYSECTDAEKKQFMQAFIERIDIFPERREDGNWIQNIKFQFPVSIIKEGKEVAKIKGVSLDKEKSDEHMISLEKLSTLETVCLLSK